MLAYEVHGHGAPLVFIHGWGANRQLWRAWILHAFAKDYQVILIDLPGHGESRPVACMDDDVLQVWLSALLAVMPPKSTLVGWSLGGLLAQAIALRHPDRVKALICIASSPCFVQRDNWLPALERSLFARYLAEVEGHTAALLKSFVALQSLGAPQARVLLKTLLAMVSGLSMSSVASLSQGLKLLSEVDFRAALQRIQVSTLWLFAESDAIVPLALVDQLPLLQPGAVVVSVADSGHLPFMSQPEITTGHIRHFLQEHEHD